MVCDRARVIYAFGGTHKQDGDKAHSINLDKPIVI